jgi:quinone-modifying oxidoreductase subunit QmoA
MAFPRRYVISPEIIGTDDAQRVQGGLQVYDAVDLDMKAKTLDLQRWRHRLGHRLGTL